MIAFPFQTSFKFIGTQQNQYSAPAIEFYFHGTPIINAERITNKEHYTK